MRLVSGVIHLITIVSVARVNEIERPKPFTPPKQLEAGGEDNTIKPPDTDDKAEPVPALTMPATAGEPDPEVKEAASEELAKMIRPATGTVAKDDKPVERKHG